MDAELESCMVYDNPNGMDLKYNLANGKILGRNFCPAYPALELGIQSGGLQNPKYIYDMSEGERLPSSASTFFQSGLFDMQQYSSESILKTADIWNFTDEVEGIKSFWDVRGTGYESALTRVMAARTDEEFEQYYGEMLAFAEDNGLTEESLAEINRLMEEKYSTDWAAMQKGYD